MMTKAIRIILTVGIIGLVILSVVFWQLRRINEQSNRREVETAKKVEDEAIPQALEKVALEEYAIEFEGAPRIEINNELCKIVKEQCQAQGVRNCEDYEMCVSGVEGQ